MQHDVTAGDLERNAKQSSEVQVLLVKPACHVAPELPVQGTSMPEKTLFTLSSSNYVGGGGAAQIGDCSNQFHYFFSTHKGDYLLHVLF